MTYKSQDTKVESVHLFIEENQYRRALEAAEQLWGKYQNWRQKEHLLVGIDIFRGLGLRRKVLACRFQLWRKDRHDSRSIHHYVRGIFDRKGPLAALQLLKLLGKREIASVSLRAEWLALHADIFAQYRDWETAANYLDQALILDPQNRRILMEKAYLDVAQDKYESAWKSTEVLLQLNYLPAVQYGAHLKTLEHDNAAAIEILKQRLYRIESISVALQLYKLYYEEGQLTLAEECLRRAKSLLPENDGSLDEGFSVAAYELALKENDTATACQVLEGVKSPFYVKVRENLVQSSDSDNQVVLDVPFVRQHHMTCAPATLTAICKYWGKQVDHLGIVEEICYDGTPNHAERRWAIAQGWEVKEFKLEPETAFALIDKGIPFTLSTVAPQSAHLQAVVGYDRRRGVYLIRDPFYPSLQEFLIEELGEQSRSSGPRCLAMVPKPQAHLYDDILFQDSDFYDDYYKLIESLEAHKRSRAEAALAEMTKRDSSHRLTLQAQRTLTRYNGNQLLELAVVDQLLLQFPEDLKLLADKAYLLDELGRYQAKIEFLESEIEKAGAVPHPLLTELLAYQLSSDNRQAERSQSLLAYTLRYQPTNAAALWNLANVHWGEGEYEQAFEYYRLCSTLEDKNEGYINSYFKAARYLKQTDEALSRLRQRVQDLGGKSIYPFESLYFALEALTLDEQALAVMERALELHPENDRVIERLVRGYLYNGAGKKSAQLFTKYKEKLSGVARLSLAADIFRFKNDWVKEISCNEKILKRQPLNYGVINSNASLLGRHQGSEVAIKFLDSRLALNEQDKTLLFMKLDWLFERSLSEQEEFCRKIIDLHPALYEGYLRLARIQMRQHDFVAAQKSAESAYEINPYNVDVACALGDIYFNQEKIDEAHDLYRRVLEYSVDADGIFNRLLKCHESFEDKQEELSIILDQLMRQTSYGNGILEYREIARNLVKDEELLVFLEKVVEIRPDLWQSWYALSSHLTTMNLLDRAIEVADKAVAKFPLLPLLYLGRANAHFVAQNLASAEKDVREALRINPQWETAIIRLSDVLEAQKRYSEALDLINEALSFAPTNSILHGCAADLLANGGEADLAIEHLSTALTLDPLYEWAWDRYRELIQKTDAPEAAKELAKSILKERPHNVTVWCKLAEFEDDLEQRLLYLDQALNHHPKNEDINLIKCRALFSLNRIGAVKELIHSEKWNNNPPISLLVFEAWMEAEYQRYDKAIELLERNAEGFPHYYNAWRLLSTWHKALGNYGRAISYVDICVRLTPHSPQTLTMAAETYLEAQHNDVEVSDEDIGAFLEKAVVLDPKDQYNSLTWFDFLIEKGMWAELERAKNITHHDPANPYYLVREVQAAARCDNQELAFQIFSKVIESEESNDWLYMTGYREIVSAGYKEALREFLHQQLGNAKANSKLGWLWALYCMDYENKAKKIFDYLQPLEQGGGYWMNAMEAIFSSEKYADTADLIIRKFGKTLADHGRLWSLVTFHYSRKQEWKKLRRWCAANWRRQSNEAWAVYLYSYGLRLIGKWMPAYKVNEFAASLPADGYYDRIIMWQLVQSVLVKQQKIDSDRLARVRFNELSSLEQYCYTLFLTVFFAERDGGLDAAEESVVASYKEAKRDYPNIAGSSVGAYLNRQIRSHLVTNYTGGLGKRLLWRFRLYVLA